MDKLDYLYRGFKNLRVQTEDNSCKRERRILKKSNLKVDKLTVTKYLCKINEDWIKAIEDGLVFVEKAVAEERQFIRSDGETVPIEKAKKVSRDSVVHLAKHSNLITHVPKDPNNPIIPDEIYMVEKLSDYAVYENRFLYMLLYQLKEFISMRLDQITKLRMTYLCDFEFNKDIDSKTRKTSSIIKFHEERNDNPYPIDDNLSSTLLKRISDCEQIVIMLLNTNLMTEVAKAPMVKPPITKTNVLKMNNNFKNSLALYDFICMYKGKGYESVEVVKEYAPFSDELSDELLELPMLVNFLTYKAGNELDSYLENRYQQEELRLKALEEEKLKERIERVKKKVIESGLGYEEYIVLLEKRNKGLERASEELLIARNEIFTLNERINELNLERDEFLRQIDDLNKIIQAKNKEIEELNQKYIEDMKAKAIAHQQEIINLTDEYQVKIANINVAHEEEIEELNKLHEENLELARIDIEKEFKDTISAYEENVESLQQEINNLNNELMRLKGECDSKVNEINLVKRDEVNSLNQKIDDLMNDYSSQIKNINELNTLNQNELNLEIKKLNEIIVAKNALINSLKVKAGMEITEDYTTKEGFMELEKQFMYFNQFFKKEWKKTKKAIRKELLWTKEEKKKIKEESKENKEEALDSNLDNNSNLDNDSNLDEPNNDTKNEELESNEEN